MFKEDQHIYLGKGRYMRKQSAKATVSEILVLVNPFNWFGGVLWVIHLPFTYFKGSLKKTHISETHHGGFMFSGCPSIRPILVNTILYLKNALRIYLNLNKRSIWRR